MRYNQPCVCGRSSSGRARPCQGRGSEFEPRRPLQKENTIRQDGVFFLEQHFCYAKVNACGRVIEREWGNPSKVPPSHSPLPCGGRECRQQNLWTITKRNTTHPGGVSFACSAALLLLLPAETQAAIKKDTPSGRMGYLFAVQLRPSFSSDGGGSCRRCGYPPAR